MSVMLEEDIQVAPLNAEELAWAKKLDALFEKMPARLKVIEVDDAIVLVDGFAATAAQDKDGSGFGAIREAGAILARIGNGTFKVTGMTH